ncbi:MAG TPA: GGDEF domain-containing protein, partial [Acidimicrobiales bacterium]|nr:GGDEF domain-containing protein [Acidimicrobiales bacterium]
SDVLSEFARTMVTDFPIQGILDHLVQRIVEILPITGAGVTLITPGADPRYVAASDQSALRFERLQTELGEGPCFLAYISGDAVAVADLRDERRFATFTRRALDAGLGAVFTFPLRTGADRLGALDLYRDEPGRLDERTMAAAQTLADVAAAYLLNAQARADLSEASERSRYSSLHDPLTSLPNRVLITELLDFAMLRAKRSGKFAAVLFVDLDQFKAVNDTYSHRVGDELLMAVADRLARLCRPGDALGRLSGDEFIMVCEDLDSPSHADVIADRISAAVGVLFELSCGPVSMTASVGIAFAGDGDNSDELLHRADTAMYQAKARGGGHHQILDLREQQATGQRTALKLDLRAAVANGELQVAYQPIVNTSDGRVTGFEALLRWPHPTRGQVRPAVLIPLAEEAGLIGQVGAWLLGQACTDRRSWSGTGASHQLGVAVNVSVHQLMAPGFAAFIEEALSSHGRGTEPALVTLEVTESVMIQDSARAVVVLDDLKRLGVNIALDDFGAGYSSLNYLDQFPVDIVKIDQTFIARLDHRQASRAVVTSIVGLSHTLGMSVVAEGVETLEQRDVLSEIGCDACQGFYFARPIPADEVAAFMRHLDSDGAVRLPLVADLPAA